MRERAWKSAFALAIAIATWGLLVPHPPGGEAGHGIRGFDKLEHLGLFAALAILAARAFGATPRGAIWLALAGYGAAIEVAQGYTGRDPEVLDAVADAIGALAAFVSRPRQ